MVKMSFGTYIVIPIVIALQAVTMMILPPYVSLTGTVADAAGLITWISFQAWAMYFLGGCTIKMAAKTLAWARKLPLVGVCSLDALAWQVRGNAEVVAIATTARAIRCGGSTAVPGRAWRRLWSRNSRRSITAASRWCWTRSSRGVGGRWARVTVIWRRRWA